MRAKVEHPIGVVKRVFGFVKVRYRGLAKNAHRLVVTCALANLLTAPPLSLALPAGVMWPELVDLGSSMPEASAWHSGRKPPLSEDRL